jgi:hypothetical protein
MSEGVRRVDPLQNGKANGNEFYHMVETKIPMDP